MFLRGSYRLFVKFYYVSRRRWLQFKHRLSVAYSNEMGVNTARRNPELIVSLTTIPERIATVSLCLDSLLRQSLKPDRLILWLSVSMDSERPFVSNAHLPADLLSLVHRGLEIRWCEDIRSYRKLIPTLRAHPEALIVTADDDILYPRHWLRLLFDAHRKEPQYLHCHRAHLIKYDASDFALPYGQWEMLSNGYKGPSIDLFPTTGGGVLYAPYHLHPDVLDIKTFMELCPNADDVWLKAMTLLAGVSCKKVAYRTFPLIEINIRNNRTLYSENVILNGNDTQIKAVAERYGVFKKC